MYASSSVKMKPFGLGTISQIVVSMDKLYGTSKPSTTSHQEVVELTRKHILFVSVPDLACLGMLGSWSVHAVAKNPSGVCQPAWGSENGLAEWDATVKETSMDSAREKWKRCGPKLHCHILSICGFRTGDEREPGLVIGPYTWQSSIRGPVASLVNGKSKVKYWEAAETKLESPDGDFPLRNLRDPWCWPLGRERGIRVPKLPMSKPEF
ncbi:hypothetical protein DFH08DRAFT_802328 [Mycena albidolilacea]|uniref:Uncharacterized protein n=1 Tax=Mycena albidolilacea TaxID=1033008 RepID=A0AAD7EZL4_9AGAR|nr:hypothetical protein DFH08DRAFT_802328 [Mycena albidolilacea]